MLGSQRRIILKGISTQTKELQPLRSRQDLGFIDRTRDREKAVRRVRDEFGQDAVDSGQEHLANSDNGFPVTTTGFDSAVAIGEFRVLFGTNQRVGDLNKTRFEISSGAGNACRLKRESNTYRQIPCRLPYSHTSEAKETVPGALWKRTRNELHDRKYGS